MRVIKALFDGKEIKPIEPIKVKKRTEVLVIFPDEVKKILPQDARRLLRGSGKGEKLVERLLKSREEDIILERRQ